MDQMNINCNLRIGAVTSDAAASKRIESATLLLGHRFTHYTSGESLLQAIRGEHFELLILDATLPDGVSMTAAHWLRLHLRPDAPVAWLAPPSASDPRLGESRRTNQLILDSLDVLQTAEAIKRLLHSVRYDQQLRFGNYRFIPEFQEVQFGGGCITLQPKEFELALLMFRSLGTLVTRRQILEEIWGKTAPPVHSRTIDTHMSKLRKRLRLNLENGMILSAMYRQGYRLVQVFTMGSEPATSAHDLMEGGFENVDRAYRLLPGDEPTRWQP